MRFRNLRKWTNPSELEGLVYFAQLLEELLFDYSLDTYKPSAMNSCTLCLEARNLLRDIENELIDPANLVYVLKELMLNLRKDEVAQSLLDIGLETIEKKLCNEQTPLNESTVIINIIHSQLSVWKYKEMNEILLLDALKNGKEKKRIRSLTRTYVTTLISIGYSSRHLYFTTRMFFHLGDNQITQCDDAKEFFKLVSGEANRYIAVFKASSFFNEIKESCADFKITVADSLDEDISAYATKNKFSLGVNDVYLINQEFEAMDMSSAREIAEHSIEQLSTLICLFHHKEIPSWKKSALIINLDEKSARVATGLQNPMLMCADSKKKAAAIKLNSFIHEFSLKDHASFRRFNRAIELHTLALKSDSPENQFLNLWVALETIVPSKLGRNKAKINNIIDSVLPFLSLCYIPKLIDKLLHDYII